MAHIQALSVLDTVYAHKVMLTKEEAATMRKASQIAERLRSFLEKDEAGDAYDQTRDCLLSEIEHNCRELADDGGFEL